MLKQEMYKNLTQDIPQRDPGPPTGGLRTTNAEFIFIFFKNQPDSPISSQSNLSRLGFQIRVYIVYTSTSQACSFPKPIDLASQKGRVRCAREALSFLWSPRTVL